MALPGSMWQLQAACALHTGTAVTTGMPDAGAEHTAHLLTARARARRRGSPTARRCRAAAGSCSTACALQKGTCAHGRQAERSIWCVLANSAGARAQEGQANCTALPGCAWQLQYGAGFPFNGFCYNASAAGLCGAQGGSAVACEGLRDPATNLQMCNVQQARLLT